MGEVHKLDNHTGWREVEISPEAYDEIQQKLSNAFMTEHFVQGRIVMDGLALKRGREPNPHAIQSAPLYNGQRLTAPRFPFRAPLPGSLWQMLKWYFQGKTEQTVMVEVSFVGTGSIEAPRAVIVEREK